MHCGCYVFGGILAYWSLGYLVFRQAFLLRYNSFTQVVKYGPNMLVYCNALAIGCGKGFIAFPVSFVNTSRLRCLYSWKYVISILFGPVRVGLAEALSKWLCYVRPRKRPQTESQSPLPASSMS